MLKRLWIVLCVLWDVFVFCLAIKSNDVGAIGIAFFAPWVGGIVLWFCYRFVRYGIRELPYIEIRPVSQQTAHAVRTFLFLAGLFLLLGWNSPLVLKAWLVFLGAVVVGIIFGFQYWYSRRSRRNQIQPY